MYISETESRILSKGSPTVRIRGKGNRAGRAAGKISFFIPDFDLSAPQKDREKSEEELFFEAKKALLHKLHRLYGEMRKESGSAWIFLMQITLLDDNIFTELPRFFLSEGKSALETVLLCRDYFYSVLSKKDGGENLFEVAPDVDDISARLISELKQEKAFLLPPQTILLCHTPLATYMVEWREHLAGVVADRALTEGHHSELALSLGIPYISSRDELSRELADASPGALIDSENGCLYINPDLATLSRFADDELKRKSRENENIFTAERPALRTNGKKPLVFAELNNLGELNRLSERYCDGIGKFASEEFYLAEMCVPDEEILFEQYRRAAETMPTKPIVIRGFRTLGSVRIESVISENSFGERSELYVLYDSTLRTQLRAVMRAAVYGSLQFLLPQSDKYSDISQCAALMDELSAELYEEDREFSPVPLGSTIDTLPSALMCEKIFEECDFAVVDADKIALALTLGKDNGTSLDALDGDNIHVDALRQIIEKIAKIAAKKKKRAILSLSKNSSADILTPALLCEFFAVSSPTENLSKIKKSILENPL